MELTFTQLLSLFFIYSLAGWLLETAAAAIFKRQLINKGYLSLPLCPIYGVEAAAFTLFLSELKGRPLFLFLGGAILSAFFTLITGHILERLLHRKWWDYRKFQFEGYLSLPVLALCGLGAVFCIRWGNPLFLELLELIPNGILRIFLIVLCVLLALDFSGSSFTLWQLRRKLQKLSLRTDSVSGSYRGRKLPDQKNSKTLDSRLSQPASGRHPIRFCPIQGGQGGSIRQRLLLSQTGLAVSAWLSSGRSDGNDLLLYNHRHPDEPQQPGLRAIQHRMGLWLRYADRLSLPLQRQKTTGTFSWQVRFSAAHTNTYAAFCRSWYSELFSGITAESPLIWADELICFTVFSGELRLWSG